MQLNKLIKNQWVYFKVNNKKTLKVKNNNKCVTKITLNSADIKSLTLKKDTYNFTITYKTTVIINRLLENVP